MTSENTYNVVVASNFHYMDQSEHYAAGVFESADDALRLARKIVDESLPAYQPGMTADQMFDAYKAFGEDPFIVPATDTSRFSAWEYAAQLCKEMCVTDAAAGFTV